MALANPPDKIKITDGNNIAVVSPAGQVQIVDPSLEIAKGTITGATHVNKFGRAPSGVQTTATDIWDRADATPTQQIWGAPPSSLKHAIVSASGTDGVNQLGARTIKIYGLTDWDTKETTETVTLNGLTTVETGSSYVIIHRMKVTANGSGNIINYGNISATGTTTARVTAQIQVGQGQTQMAVYGIPSVQTAYAKTVYTSLHDASASPSKTFQLSNHLCVNEWPHLNGTTFITKLTFGVDSVTQSDNKHIYEPPLKIQGPAIIKMQCFSNQTDSDVSAGFDLIIIDN